MVPPAAGAIAPGATGLRAPACRRLSRKLRAAAATALLTSGCGFLALAQTYPAKLVSLISGFPATGTSDYHARVLAQKLTELFGHGVIVATTSPSSRASCNGRHHAAMTAVGRPA